MADSDYYQTLGVSRDASPEDVRRAYKKLARQYHPDANPDDPSAAEKFKEVQEAYSVLNDPEKRTQYDRFGKNFRGAAGQGPFQYPWGSGGSGAGPIDLGDLFGSGGIDLGDLLGGGRRGRRGPVQQAGEDVQLEIDIPFQIAAEGGNHSLTLNRGGKTERINVKIPPGVHTGSVIRLAGQGNPGVGGGPAGDLKLTIHVAPHPWFRRDGADLHVDVPVTPTEAALGAKVEVPTLTEGRLKLTVPAGTSSGTKLRLRGKGVVDPKTKKKGNLYAIIKIVVPDSLSDEAQDLYRRLETAAPLAPRDGLW
jgi:DnaJ-class molecular chaperone